MKWAIAGAVLAVGFLVLVYPIMHSKYYSWKMEKLVSAYDKEVRLLARAEAETDLQSARLYNDNIAKESIPLPLYETERVPDLEYETQLKMEETGVMGIVEIPCLKLRVPILPYADTNSLEKHGTGHLHGSSVPVGGEGTHSVIMAYKGAPENWPFDNLERMEENKLFYLHILDRVLVYQVEQVQRVNGEDMPPLVFEDNKDLCTLLACAPYGRDKYCILVKGHRVPYSLSAYREEAARTVLPHSALAPGWLFYVGICVMLTGTMYISVISIFKRFQEVFERQQEEMKVL